MSFLCTNDNRFIKSQVTMDVCCMYWSTESENISRQTLTLALKSAHLCHYRFSYHRLIAFSLHCHHIKHITLSHSIPSCTFSVSVLFFPWINRLYTSHSVRSALNSIYMCMYICTRKAHCKCIKLAVQLVQFSSHRFKSSWQVLQLNALKFALWSICHFDSFSGQDMNALFAC